MNIFIDGYNLLKQLHGVKNVSDAEKSSFSSQLKKFIHYRHHQVFLVYDGGDHAHPTISRLGDLTIIQSGYYMSADDVIKQRMMHYAQEHTLLVSDDRQLCDYVAAAGYASLGTTDFYTLLQKDIDKDESHNMKQGSAHKFSGYVSTAEIDDLMHLASCCDYQKESECVIEDASHLQKLSKKEKKLKKLVKKL